MKNYIDKKGQYINVENKTLREIWLEGYEAGRKDQNLMKISDDLRNKETKKSSDYNFFERRFNQIQ